MVRRCHSCINLSATEHVDRWNLTAASVTRGAHLRELSFEGAVIESFLSRGLSFVADVPRSRAWLRRRTERLSRPRKALFSRHNIIGKQLFDCAVQT